VSYFKVRLPRGTVKVKPFSQLRRRELDREVPVWKIGGLFVVLAPKKLAV
jgi:hypothetical protein